MSDKFKFTGKGERAEVHLNKRQDKEHVLELVDQILEKYKADDDATIFLAVDTNGRHMTLAEGDDGAIQSLIIKFLDKMIEAAEAEGSDLNG